MSGRAIGIKCSGPIEHCREAALERARELGFADPVVADSFPVVGARVALIQVVVAERGTALPEAPPRRRLGRRTSKREGAQE